MDSERIKQLLCQFFINSGKDNIVNDIKNMQLSPDSQSSDLATLLNLANLAGGEQLLKNRIKPTKQQDNREENVQINQNTQNNQNKNAQQTTQFTSNNSQISKPTQKIYLPTVLLKRANFEQKTKCSIPECKIAGLFRSIFDSSLQFSGLANNRFSTLYQEIPISSLDEKTKQLIRPVVMNMKVPFYDYYSKMDGITRRNILTQPLTKIEHKDFERFSGEYEILNQKFTEQMIQFFMLFRIKLLKLFKFLTIKQIKSSLKVFENFMTEKNNILEIDLGKLMLSVRELPAKHFDALCMEMELESNDDIIEMEKKVEQPAQQLFNTDNINSKVPKITEEIQNVQPQFTQIPKGVKNDPLLNILYQQIEKIMQNQFWSEDEKQLKIQPYIAQIKQLEQINAIQDDIQISGSFSEDFNSDSNDADSDIYGNNSSDLSSPDGPGFVSDGSENSEAKDKSEDNKNESQDEKPADAETQNKEAEPNNSQPQTQKQQSNSNSVQQPQDNNIQSLGKSLWTESDLHADNAVLKPTEPQNVSQSSHDDTKMLEVPVEEQQTIDQEKSKVLAQLLPVPNTKSDSGWFIRIRVENNQVQISQPTLPVTSYVDFSTLRQTEVREEILNDPRFKSLQTKMQNMRDRSLLETLYDVLDDSNVNVQFPQHQDILSRLPPQIQQIAATQFPNDLNMKVYFDGMRIGGSNMQQFVTCMEGGDDEDDDESIDKVLLPGETIAGGRYKVQEACGAATFSNCYHITDEHGRHLCLKVVKGHKEYTDSALDEIRLLQYVKDAFGSPVDDEAPYDPKNHEHLIRIYDFFYYREHLMIVFPLLGEDLYIHYENRRQKGLPNDFSVDVIREIASQALIALNSLHSLQILHLDVKPENVLVQKGFVGGLTPPNVTLIDLGSASFACDRLQSYIQSRSYRAPELMFGAPYDSRADVWSIGGVLAEALTGKVLFPNHPVPTMLARMAAFFGPFPTHLSLGGRVSQRYLTLGQLPFNDGAILKPQNGLFEQWLFGDEIGHLNYREMLFADFIRQALTLDPERRPTAAMLLQHPFIAE